MKKFLFLFIVVMVHFYANAQLFVSSYGEITIPNRLFLTGNGNTFRFLPNNPGTEIGSSYDQIDFWYSTTGYHVLVASKFDKVSDIRLKTNIFPLKNGLDILKDVNIYTFNYIEQEEKVQRKHYGVIAQEIQEILPELIDSTKGYLAVDYDEFIPMLINAVKELNDKVTVLEKQLTARSTSNAKEDEIDVVQYDVSQKMTVQQNGPNPFSSATTIQCYIPQNISHVHLCIYNMQGAQVKCIPVADKGDVTISVAAGQLATGVYTYLLIGDNQTSDAKQMILTK